MMTKPTTLVILSPAFPADEQDVNWVPSQALLARTLKERDPDWSVIVLTFIYPAQRKRYSFHGVEVIPFDGMKFRKWRRPLLWWAIFKQLKKIKRQYHLVGLLSFWCQETAFIGSWFGWLFRIRHRCWIAGQDAREFNRWIPYIRPHANELVAMSPFLRWHFDKNHGILPANVICNAIRPDLFPVSKGGERDIDILGVGSLHPLKQYELFIDVVDILRMMKPDLKAVHTGGGDEKPWLGAKIADSGLEKNCLLIGEQPHPEVLRLMQRARIFLHPSSYEGYSTVCLEALYAGAHVISFWDPMDDGCDRWHVVEDLDEMIKKVIDILSVQETNPPNVLLYDMHTTADEIKELFTRQQPTGA